MILMYHKVFIENPTIWWVDTDNFYRQMSELQNKNVVYLDDYNPEDPNHCVITFDGVYNNILTFAGPILHKFGYPFELFITGNYLGADNSFDKAEPMAVFASKDELEKLVGLGGRLQWHTRTHTDLTSIRDKHELYTEFNVPNKLREIDPRGFKWIAYPNGNFNGSIQVAAKKNFSGGVSCHQGDDKDIYALNRITVKNETSFRSAKIAVIIPCFNYGHYLTEAIESVLRQTIPVHEILIADDCSSDNTDEIASEYVKQYPSLVRYNRNISNAGIVKNFNLAVSMTESKYICFLGADNRFLSNYIERCASVLDSSDDIAIAYTDCALFGPRAELAYSQYGTSFRGKNIQKKVFFTNFPEFDKNSSYDLKKHNFIHGSSMFKRTAYEMVGGYRSNQEFPEDHDLFLRMVLHNWKAKKAKTYLEYRQHSIQQANITLNSYYELLFYKRKVKALEQELRNWQSNPLTAYFKNRIRPLIHLSLKTIKEEGMRNFFTILKHYCGKFYTHGKS